jgi:predicted ferric reductase
VIPDMLMTRIFPGIITKGCFFHYTQCIWRKTQDTGLQIHLITRAPININCSIKFSGNRVFNNRFNRCKSCRYEVYACGPPKMVKSAAKSFVEQGMIQDNFFSDAFVFAFTGKK